MLWINCVNHLINICDFIQFLLCCVLPWLSIIVMMTFFICLKRLVSPPRRFISYLLETVFPARGPHMCVSPLTYHAALLFPVHLSQALIEPTSMCLVSSINRTDFDVPVLCEGSYQNDDILYLSEALGISPSTFHILFVGNRLSSKRPAYVCVPFDLSSGLALPSPLVSSVNRTDFDVLVLCEGSCA